MSSDSSRAALLRRVTLRIPQSLLVSPYPQQIFLPQSMQELLCNANSQQKIHSMPLSWHAALRSENLPRRTLLFPPSAVSLRNMAISTKPSRVTKPRDEMPSAGPFRSNTSRPSRKPPEVNRRQRPALHPNQPRLRKCRPQELAPAARSRDRLRSHPLKATSHLPNHAFCRRSPACSFRSVWVAMLLDRHQIRPHSAAFRPLRALRDRRPVATSGRAHACHPEATRTVCPLQR